jgi:membrane associated rhomboid family serine protease
VVIQVFSGAASVGYSHLSREGVAWWAHVGGFVAGMALILLLRPKQPYRHRPDLNW